MKGSLINMKSKSFRCVVASFISVCMLLSFCGSINIYADTQSDLQQQLQRYQNQKKELNGKLSDLKNNIASQEAYQATLNQKISLMNTQLNSISASIFSAKNEIDAKNADIENNRELFKARLRAMYMTDDTSYIAAVLGAGSYSEMLMKSETLKRVAAHDSALIERLTEDVKTIEKKNAELDSMKAIVEEQLLELDEAYAESELVKQTIESQKKIVESDIKQVSIEEASVQAEINRIISGNQSTGTLSSTNWLWPVPTSRYISCYFGPGTLYGKPRNHTGVDIAAPLNTPIVASNDGKVISVVTNYTQGVGYGKYIIIDHGSGYYTVYAHCNSILISQGQYVAKGQTIAYMGSTGNSTGPHLHFEVRINNVCQNPLNYISR